MNDVFVEQIIEQRPTTKSNLIKLGIALAAILISSVVLFFAVLRVIFPVTLALCCWGAYILIKSQNLEFEYSYTNGELDIDKIMGRRRRQHILSVRVRTFDIFAPMTAEFEREFTSNTIIHTEDVSSSPKAPNRWFAKYVDNEGRTTLLIFEPNERMIAAIAGMIPHKAKGLPAK